MSAITGSPDRVAFARLGWDYGDAGDSSTPPPIFYIFIANKGLMQIDPWVTQA